MNISNRLKDLRKALKTLGADAALISSELNIKYMCAFDYTDGYLLITKENAYLLTDFRYLEAAQKCVEGFEILTPERDMLSEIALLLSINGSSSLAVEEDSISLAQHEKLSAQLKSIAIVCGASKILRDMREIKTDDELKMIENAQEITDKAFAEILSYITPERTELEIALELEFSMRKMGAEGVAFNTIAVSGSSSALPHGVPQNRKLQKGFLTMDFGARLGGYCSDMTRTVVIGRADSEMKKVYSTVLCAQAAALEAIHEGMLCRDADKTARDIITAAGYGQCFGHSLGHGVGLFIHEAPSLSSRARDNCVLRRGNVVTVEPGIYIEGKYGCRIEDMIAIDNDGNIRNFTKSTKELIEIG